MKIRTPHHWTSHWSNLSAPEIIEAIVEINKTRGKRNRVGPFRFVIEKDEKFGRETLSCERRFLFKRKEIIFSIQTVSAGANSESGQVFYRWDREITRIHDLGRRLKLYTIAGIVDN